ncbi:unnamed protein product [Meganyctiphanes norvegica]|uniref:Uncharacterized protein n=1 Tax=Meganyctiphanes norvegica TaxID=48144 RepID=A0AAV2SXH0_MEGNR
MAEALRRSSRLRRICRDPEYNYDSEFEEIVNSKLSRRVTWHSSLSEADSKSSLTVTENRGENSVSAAPVSWSDLNFYKLAYISVQDSSQQSGSVSPAHSAGLPQTTQSQIPGGFQGHFPHFSIFKVNF